MGLRPLAWPRFYYAATVLFALADWLLGANVRAVGFATSPRLRIVYYAACLGCGVLIHLRPKWSALITLAESSINLAVLVLSVLLPYYAAIDALSDGNLPPTTPITTAFVLNFLIVGGVSAAVFYGSLDVIRGSPSRIQRTP